VGFVVDTQHTYAAGYDWVNDLEIVISQIEKTLGLKNVKSIHLNDSKMDCGSNKDRHADLGEGKLGEETIRKILKHPKLKKVPFILETPALKASATMEREIERLKELAK